jgi:hypothetical protein
MNSDTQITEILIEINPNYQFLLKGGLPTLEENQQAIAKDEAEIQLAGKEYWQILKDLTLRQQLAHVLNWKEQSKLTPANSDALRLIILRLYRK